MAEPELKRFGNSSQPSTSDLVKTVYKKLSGKTCILEDEGKTLPETQKAGNHDKPEDIYKYLEYRPDDGFDLIKSVDSEEKVEDFVDKLLPFEHNDDQSLKLPECTPFPVPGRSCSETLKEFIGTSDFGVIWKENLQSHKGSSKNAEIQEFSLMKTKGQMNEEKRMELDDSLKADGESKASLEHGISVAKSNAMSSKSKVCLRNVLFGNVNDMFDIGNALVDNSNALFDNGIVSVYNGNASGNGNATVGIQPDDQSNTLPSLNPYKSMPQKPPDPAQYTISPELREALQSNLRLKSEQTRRALQERFHPYKQQKDKSKKFQTSLPILPEFE